MIALLIAAITLGVWPTAASADTVEWEELPGNPIFGQARNDGPKAYYPSIIFNRQGFARATDRGSRFRYRMWYGTSLGQTALAVSKDGLRWRDLGVVISNGYHATVKYFRRGFPGADSGDDRSADRMFYRVWYWDPTKLYMISAMRYAESPDGMFWHNDQPLQNGDVPIVTGQSPDWNAGTYGPCDIIYERHSDQPFAMYYNGTTGGDEAIGLARSADGLTWTGYDADGAADPVLSGTNDAGDWDFDYVGRATVIKRGRHRYEMWYSGGNGALNHGIGYAVSTDGRTWVRDEGNPIFHKNDGVGWRVDRTYTPAVLPWRGQTYKMWFAGQSEAETSIGYAIGKRTHGERKLAAEEPIGSEEDQDGLRLTSHPNPFNPDVTIRFQLGAPAPVRLAVFDVLGRPVRRLFVGSLQPGLHGVVWDGRDDGGRDVGSGRYFYRVLTGNVRETGQMTLLR